MKILLFKSVFCILITMLITGCMKISKGEINNLIISDEVYMDRSRVLFKLDEILGNNKTVRYAIRLNKRDYLDRLFINELHHQYMLSSKAESKGLVRVLSIDFDNMKVTNESEYKFNDLMNSLHPSNSEKKDEQSNDLMMLLFIIITLLIIFGIFPLIDRCERCISNKRMKTNSTSIPVNNQVDADREEINRLKSLGYSESIIKDAITSVNKDIE